MSKNTPRVLLARLAGVVAAVVLLQVLSLVGVLAPPGLAEAAGGKTTPELLQAAVDQGAISNEQRLLYLGYAMFEPGRVPPRYIGTGGWDATHYLASLQTLNAPGSFRTRFSAQAVSELQRIAQQAASLCNNGADGPKVVDTADFRVAYTDDVNGGGVTSQEYADLLQKSFDVLVTRDGFPKAPLSSLITNNKYPVQIAPIAGGTLGYVLDRAHPLAGFIGDNPNTKEPETAAHTSCMVLGSQAAAGKSGDAARAGIHALVAHEYFHSIQSGTGDPMPLESEDWYESISTHVMNEIEPRDDGPYGYDFPFLRECLTNYPDTGVRQYSNWPLLRYGAERFGGSGTAAGMSLMKDWVVGVARGDRAVQTYAAAIAARGGDFNDQFHNYAITMRFLKSCTSGSIHCIGVAPQLSRMAANQPGGNPTNDDAAVGLGGSVAGAVRNSYAVSYVGLPGSGSYAVSLANSSTGGVLHASVVADMGDAVQVVPLPGLARAGQTVTLPNYTVPSGAAHVTLVITNQDFQNNYGEAQGPGQPRASGSCAQDAFAVSLGAASGPAAVAATPTPLATPAPTPIGGAIPAPIANGARLFAPMVPNRTAAGSLPGTFQTSIVVANPGTVDANVRLTFVREDGLSALPQAPTFVVKPGASTTTFVPNVAGLGDGRYAAVIDADQSVYGIVNLASSAPATSASYNAVPSADASTTLYVPSVYRKYVGYSSTIEVQNASSTAADVTVTYKRAGLPDIVERRTIPGDAGFALDQLPNELLGDAFVGAAVIQSSVPLVAIYNVSVTQPSPQLASSNAASLARDGAQTVELPVIYNSYYGYNTSVTVQNLDSASASVTLTYYDAAGKAVGTQNGAVDAGGSAKFLQFASGGSTAPVPAGFNGSAVVSSAEGRKLVAVAYVQSPDLGYFSAYNGSAAQSATTRTSCPAILKNYYGYSTSMAVQNAGTAPTTLTIRYVNSAGQLVDTVQVENLQPGAIYFTYTPGNATLADGFNGAAIIQSSVGKVVAVVNELLSGKPGDQLFTYNCFPG